jgi:acetyltransferase-like isoleucine patch superfamily enzyme
MNLRILAGGCAAFFYNAMLSRMPSRRLRRAYLRHYLGALGAGASMQMGCRLLNGRKIFLGERTVVNFGCLLDGRVYTIRTGSDVSVGPEAAILTLGHDPHSSDFGDKGGDVIIGNNVWIAFRAVILPGVEIGEGAVVAAGAVVTRNVAPFTIVAGIPAKVVGNRPAVLKLNLNYDPFLV